MQVNHRIIDNIEEQMSHRPMAYKVGYSDCYNSFLDFIKKKKNSVTFATDYLIREEIKLWIEFYLESQVRGRDIKYQVGAKHAIDFIERTTLSRFSSAALNIQFVDLSRTNISLIAPAQWH